MSSDELFIETVELVTVYLDQNINCLASISNSATYNGLRYEVWFFCDLCSCCLLKGRVERKPCSTADTQLNTTTQSSSLFASPFNWKAEGLHPVRKLSVYSLHDLLIRRLPGTTKGRTDLCDALLFLGLINSTWRPHTRANAETGTLSYSTGTQSESHLYS